MKYKDTLRLFDELVAGGATESSARANATQLGSFGEFLDDFKSSNEKSFREIDNTLLSIKKDLLWMRIIGAGLILIFSANLLQVVK